MNVIFLYCDILEWIWYNEKFQYLEDLHNLVFSKWSVKVQGTPMDFNERVQNVHGYYFSLYLATVSIRKQTIGE